MRAEDMKQDNLYDGENENISETPDEAANGADDDIVDAYLINLDANVPDLWSRIEAGADKVDKHRAGNADAEILMMMMEDSKRRKKNNKRVKMVRIISGSLVAASIAAVLIAMPIMNRLTANRSMNSSATSDSAVHRQDTQSMQSSNEANSAEMADDPALSYQEEQTDHAAAPQNDASVAAESENDISSDSVPMDTVNGPADSAAKTDIVIEAEVVDTVYSSRVSATFYTVEIKSISGEYDTGTLYIGSRISICPEDGDWSANIGDAITVRLIGYDESADMWIFENN